MFKLIVLAVYLRTIKVDPHFLIIALTDFGFLIIKIYKTPFLFLLNELVDWDVATPQHFFRFENICIYQP